MDEQSNAPLWKLQNEITKAIREVDKKHIIFLEGNAWGNNYNGFTGLIDNNTAFSFHKYWSYNDDATIKGPLELREKYNAPIWLGETGENSNVWFTELIQLMDKHNIGYAWWPMKKIDNIAAVTNVHITPEYQQLLDYWKKGGTKPSKEFATKALMKIADNFKLENTRIMYDVIDAMFRQPTDPTTKPFKNHSIPTKVLAYEYDLGRIGSAYSDKDFINLWASDPSKRSEWNSGQQLRNDGVDIYKGKNNTYYVGKIEDGEWIQYTVNSKQAKSTSIVVNYANATTASTIKLTDENGKTLGVLSLPATGGTENWKTATLQNIAIKKGENKLRFVFDKGDFNFQSFDIK